MQQIHIEEIFNMNLLTIGFYRKAEAVALPFSLTHSLFTRAIDIDYISAQFYQENWYGVL